MGQAAATEARKLANWSYLALLILGVLIALGGLWWVVTSLALIGLWWLGGFFLGALIPGIIILALGGFGAFTAFTVWKPKIVDAIDHGKYAEAYQVASNPIQLIIGLICGGVIPAILLYLTQQKLAEIVRPAPPPPPP